MSKDLSSLREELTKSGFRPAPLAFLLHGVRRLLWPVIRQYHFFQLETLVDVTRDMDAALVRSQEALITAKARLQSEGRATRAELISRYDSLQAELDGSSERVGEWLKETQKLTTLLVTLRSDVAALTNRTGLLAEDLYRHTAEGGQAELILRLEQLEAKQRRMLEESNPAAELASLREELQFAKTEIAGLRSQLASQQQESAARTEAILSRFAEQAQDALFRMSLPLAELRAEIAVLRSRMDKSSGEAATQAHSSLLESISQRESELASTIKELEWRSRLYLRHTHGGLFVLKRADVICEFVAAGHTWDSHILEVAQSVASKARGTAVDVGAHFGFMAAHLAGYFDRVITFEPNDFTYSILRANVVLNGLENVECHHTALYSRDCDVSLGRADQQEIPLPIQADGAFDGPAATNLGALLFTENGTGIFQQKARTLDSFMLDNVTFLKIDAQGADGEILKGCVDTLRRCRPVVVFEWEEFLSRNFGTTFEEIQAMLSGLGYTVELLHRTNEKQADYVARCA